MPARRYTFFLLLLLISAIIISGCGGGGGQPASDQNTSNTAQPDQTGGDQPPVPTTTTSAQDKIPRDFKLSDEMPDFIKKAVSEKRPFVIVFFLKGDYTWNEAKPEIDNVKETYKQISFFYIDIDSTKKDPKKSKLAKELEVNYLPEIFLINQESKIVYQHSGYIDRDTFKNEIHQKLSLK